MSSVLTLLGNIPQSLKDFNSWVGWKLSEVSGAANEGSRTTKIPIDPKTGAKASVTKPGTWGSFDQAVAAQDEYELDGVGLVLRKEDRLVGIDLDDCVLDDGTIKPEAQQVVDVLATYTEKSPSGKGLRLFLRGNLQGRGKRRGSFEFYDDVRYLTVTGDHVPATPLVVEERQAELDQVYAHIFSKMFPAAIRSGGPAVRDDDEILAMARQARNGGKFAALFDLGDTSEYGGDDSRADLALCSMLSYWCGGDEKRIDRLFRASALMRSKWDEARGESTYGALTIAKATESSEDDQPVEECAAERQNAKQLLLSLTNDWDFFHDPSRSAFASVPVGNHIETYSCPGQDLRLLLYSRYFLATGEAPPAQSVADTLSVLEARALHGGICREVYLRVGGAGGASPVYIDLGDPDWRVVEIDATGWRILSLSPVTFRRGQGAKALPEPVHGGRIDELRQLVNVADDQFVLLVAAMIGMLRPNGPFPVLVLVGEQGTAKTSAALTLRKLIDPAKAPARSLPRADRELLIEARHSWMLVLDNVSRLPDWLSDALCRIATGSGYAARRLYTDSSLEIFESARGVVLTGIGDFVTRGDLVDRSIVVRLQPIAESERRTEEDLSSTFNAVAPRVLGALFDAVSAAIRNLETVQLAELPRMADFARWVHASEEACPWEPGAFLAAYRLNRAEAIEDALAADPLFAVLENLLSQGAFSGSPTELLARINGLAGEPLTTSPGWPRTASALGTRLTRLAPLMRAKKGIHIDRGKGHGGRRIDISRQTSED